jgi:DNA-binding transcriptional ArsR family regulator
MRTDIMRALAKKSLDDKLTVEELACALYEGTAHVQNLAEKLARIHGKAEALSFYDLMGDDVQNFWRGIAQQIIEHSSHWVENRGSVCRLDEAETARLKALPRVIGSAEGR